MFPIDAAIPLVVFVALVLVLSLLALTASGHFPQEHRRPALASGSGLAVLFGSIIVAMMCLVAGLTAAWLSIPWYAAVIGGGAAILVTPLVLQQLPDRFVDGCAALQIFSITGIFLTLVLIWLSGGMTQP